LKPQIITSSDARQGHHEFPFGNSRVSASFKIPGKFPGISMNCYGTFQNIATRIQHLAYISSTRVAKTVHVLVWESGSRLICSCRTSTWLTISKIA